MATDRAAVEAVNSQFYKALEKCDLDGMEKVWLHESWVRCVHPGADVIVGWDEIRESWAAIFANTQGMRLSLSNIFIKVAGEFAWVECTEDIATFFEQGFTSGQAQATNLFVKVNENWLMVHHHASAMPVDVPDDWNDDIVQ